LVAAAAGGQECAKGATAAIRKTSSRPAPNSYGGAGRCGWCPLGGLVVAAGGVRAVFVPG
jgi:hypothetical protein